MVYTIKQLAKISGVSTRTLRFYDEIDLLKPAFYGENQYRYYKEEQLLILQQILFYRELDFSLRDIGIILNKSSFDKISSLQSHQKLLQEKMTSITAMLKTIDRTILYLKGEITMQVEEFFDPIRLKNRTIQQAYEKYLIENDVISKDEIDASWEKIKLWSEDDWNQFKGDGDRFYQEMAKAIDAGLTPHSQHVQKLVHDHYLLIQPLWCFSQKSYIKLAEAYLKDENFKQFCNLYHIKLHHFLIDSMTYYAKIKLL